MAMNPATGLAKIYLIASRPFRRRGFHSFMRLVKRILPMAALRERWEDLGGGVVFSFPAGDPYWLSYFETGRIYEPELAHLISRFSSRQILFLDCGANFGYWSVRNASRARQVVAVEASSETYAWLDRNRRANGESFLALHRAVNDGIAPTVRFEVGTSHAGRSIAESNLAATEEVATTTIDALTEDYAVPGDIIFVKLDVEGAEISAFRGAARTLAGNSIFLYEDHRKDRSSAITAWLLQQGRKVFFPAADGKYLAIHSADQATAVKLARSAGFNFVTFGDMFDESALANWPELKRDDLFPPSPSPGR